MREEENFNDILTKTAGRLTNIVLLGFFTVLCSLPVVTAGAAFTALNSATKAYLYKNEDKALRVFFAVFKKHFKISTIVWLINLVAIAVLVWDLVYYRTGSSTIDILASSAVFTLLLFVMYEISLIFVIIGEEVSNDVVDCFKMSLRMAMHHFWRTSCLILITGAVFSTVYYFFRGLLPFSPGLIAYLSWQIIPEIFKAEKKRLKALENQNQ